MASLTDCDYFVWCYIICCLSCSGLSVWSFVISAKQSAEESQEKEMEMFKKLYVEWKGEQQFKDPQYKTIPRFYFKVLLWHKHFLHAV